MWKILAVLVALGACGGRQQSPAQQQSLEAEAATTLDEMRARDSSLDPLLSVFAGYIVFPEVGAAGALVAGGAHGRGVLYVKGRVVGHVTLNQASIGPQLGGHTFSELIILQNDSDVLELRNGEFSLGGGAAAVMLDKGRAGSATFDRGTSVFVMPRGGAMAGIAVGGQRIRFEPAG